LSYSRYDPRPRDDVVAIPRVWVTFALSLILHALALLYVLPHLPLLKQGDDAKGEVNGPLSVRLTARANDAPSPPPAPAREAPPLTATPPPRPAPRARPSPPVIAVAPRPAPLTPPVLAPPPPAPPAPAPAPIEGDMAAYVAARRRARGESGESAMAGSNDKSSADEDEKSRRDRLVAANLGNLQSQVFGNEPKNGGGTFQIRNMGYDSADFTFFGWNKDIKRRTFQVIEVRKGDNADINIAIVRKIIAIIREYEQGSGRFEQRDAALAAVGADADDGALPDGIAASSLTAWLRMRAPVAPNGWPSATLPPLGFMRRAGTGRIVRLDAGLVAQELGASSAFEMEQHLRREGLVDLPQRDVVIAQAVARQEPRDAKAGAISRPSTRKSTAAISQSTSLTRGVLGRQLGQPRLGGDPEARRAVGQRRRVAGGERALAAGAVERRRQPRQLFQRRVLARDRVAVANRRPGSPGRRRSRGPRRPLARWWLCSALASCSSRGRCCHSLAVISVCSPMLMPVVRLLMAGT
jgi:hypothetical protein